ncbi:MAG: hypothetical protein ETSY2_19530, partial [Candidatus Entotheonella gemina]
SPLVIDFGEIELGESQTADLVIESTGNVPATVTNIEIVEGLDAGFALQETFGDDMVLNPGDSMTVTMVYTPVDLGDAQGSVRVESDTGNVEVTLTGTAVAVPVSIAVSPQELVYGSVLLGESRELEFTISNPSEGQLRVSAIRVSQGSDSGFALSEPFSGPVDVAPGSVFPVTVVFTPIAAGEVEGSVEIESNAAEGLVIVALSGSGETAPTPRLVVEPEAIAFGEVILNGSQTQELTLRNEGSAALTVDTIVLTSGGDVGFAIIDGPSESFEIVPGGEFVVEVTLTPADEGELAGNVQITSDSEEGSPTDVPLSGVGVAQPTALIEVEPTDEVDFGNVELEQTRSVTMTITNSGDAELTLTLVSVPEGAEVGFALEGGPIEEVDLAPGESREVTVTFTPVDEALVTGLFRVESNAANEPVVERPLRGTGTPVPMPVVTVTPEQVDFGSVDVGEQATAEIDIENTGDADLTVEDILITQGADSGFGVTDVPGEPTVLAPGE